MLICPDCNSCKIKKNGNTHYGKQNHKCKMCGRQFVIDNVHTISEQQRLRIKKALNERISLHGICRVFDVSFNWLISFAIEVWQSVPEDLGIGQDELTYLRTGDAQPIVLQLDEAWSFVGSKSNKCWIWVVFDPVYRKVIVFHIGNRGKESAEILWRKIPLIYKQDSKFATDYWEAYRSVIPTENHLIGKKYTQIIEGFFAGMRARVSRLVRRNLAFSKKWENHELALRFYFWNFNIR